MQWQAKQNDESEREFETPLEMRVLFVNRVAKVMAGGRRFRFTALVAVGDRNGRVGLAYAKAPEVVDAIRKADELARKNLITVYRKGTTIPYEVKEHYCATTILLRPAREGSGITAGGPARALLALAGVSDCTARYFGSNSRINCAKVAFEALKKLKDPAEIIESRRNFAARKLKAEREKGILPATPASLAEQEEILKEGVEEAEVNASAPANVSTPAQSLQRPSPSTTSSRRVSPQRENADVSGQGEDEFDAPSPKEVD